MRAAVTPSRTTCATIAAFVVGWRLMLAEGVARTPDKSWDVMSGNGAIARIATLTVIAHL